MSDKHWETGFIGDTELYQSREVNKGGVLSRLGVGKNFVNLHQVMNGGLSWGI